MTDLVCRRGPQLLTIAVMLARWNHCGFDPWLACSVSGPPAGLTAIVATQRSGSTRFISVLLNVQLREFHDSRSAHKKALGAGQETSAGWVLQWMAEWVKDCRPAPNT